MTNKHVYFVRHGESFSNATGIRQGPETPLTDLGRAQAKRIGERLAGLSIERIVKSPFTRAEETTRIITAHLPDVPEEGSALFIERRNPSALRGKSDGDPESRRIWDAIERNYHVPGWRHSDEENFEELRGRVRAALAFLEQLPERRLLVVTHGLFMKMLFAEVLLGETLDGRIFWDRFVPMKNVANTGIMHLEHARNYHGTGNYWKIISWNDHAHLGRDLA